jgi:hypothetical protein
METEMDQDEQAFEKVDHDFFEKKDYQKPKGPASRCCFTSSFLFS